MADDVKTGIRLEVEGEDEFKKALGNAAGAANELKDNLSEAAGAAERSGQKIADDLELASLQARTSIANIIAGVGELSAALIGEINEVAAYGDAVDKSAQALGISAQAYQEWDYILQSAGSSMKQSESMFKSLAKASKYATDRQAEAFASIGLSMEEVRGLGTEQLFESVIRGLQGMEEGAERTAIATTLLGGSADKLGPLLNSSAEDIEDMRHRAHELKKVMSDEDIAAAAAYQDSITDLETAINGAKMQLLDGFMPALTTARQGLADFLANDVNWDSVSESVGKITEKMTSLAGYLIEHGDTVAGIIETIGVAWGAWKGTEFVMNLVNNVRSLYGWMEKLGAVMGAGGASTMAGIGVAALGVYTVLDRMQTLDEIGFLGDGHELQEYADNIAYLEAALAGAQLDFDNLALNGGDLTMAQDQIDLYTVALKHAREEYEAVLAARAAGEEQGGADPAAAVIETETAVTQTLAETERQTAASSGRMLETVDRAAGEIGTSFAEGTDEMSSAAARAIENTNDVMIENMGTLSVNAAIWGEDMMISFANGMISGYNSWVLDALDQITGGIEARLGFSEPEIGPLSRFHTFAPDMMALFAKGIRDNRWMVTDAVSSSFDLAPYLETAGGRAAPSYSYGGVNVTFEVRDGQNGRELFEEFSHWLREDMAREGAVFA